MAMIRRPPETLLFFFFLLFSLIVVGMWSPGYSSGDFFFSPPSFPDFLKRQVSWRKPVLRIQPADTSERPLPFFFPSLFRVKKTVLMIEMKDSTEIHFHPPPFFFFSFLFFPPFRSARNKKVFCSRSGCT